MSQDKNSVKMGSGFKWALGIAVVVIVVMLIILMTKSGNLDELQIKLDKEKVDALAKLAEDKDLIIGEKDVLILELQNPSEPVDEEGKPIVDSSIGYLIDELLLGVSVDEILSDREVPKLFDLEVEVDGEDYDAEEVFSLVDWNLEANDKDFLGDVYMTVPRDGVEYKVVFDLSLNTSLIDDEDSSLEFSFLGKPVEVVEWDVDEVTFFVGEMHSMILDEILMIDGREIVLNFISEDEAYIVVDGEGEKIAEGETGRFNGLEIKVDTVLFTDFNPSQNRVQMIIGNDVENSVSDGEEYDEDSIWEWKIDASSMGIVLKEEYMELDDELKPLNVGETLCLPNDYICVVYDGMVDEDMEEYSFELDTRNGVDYVEVRGNFINGLADYDRVFINATGIYDEDIVFIGSQVDLGDSDVALVLNGANLEIDNIVLPLDLTTVTVGANILTTEEDSYRNNYGILIEDPEANIEDNEARLIVPEEKLEASLRVY